MANKDLLAQVARDALSMEEAAEYLQVTPARIQQLSAQGRLGIEIKTRMWLYTREELDAYNKERKHNVGGRPRRQANEARPSAERLKQQLASLSPAEREQLLHDIEGTASEKAPTGGRAQRSRGDVSAAGPVAVS